MKIHPRQGAADIGVSLVRLGLSEPYRHAVVMAAVRHGVYQTADDKTDDDRNDTHARERIALPSLVFCTESELLVKTF